MSKPNNIGRDIEIYERRKAGEKYKAIGAQFGLGPERTRQIYKRMSRRIITQDDWKSSLSIRNQNALRQLGVNTMAEIMDIRPQTFLRIRNYGIESFRELLGMLRRYGYDWK